MEQKMNDLSIEARTAGAINRVIEARKIEPGGSEHTNLIVDLAELVANNREALDILVNSQGGVMRF